MGIAYIYGGLDRTPVKWIRSATGDGVNHTQVNALQGQPTAQSPSKRKPGACA